MSNLSLHKIFSTLLAVLLSIALHAQYPAIVEAEYSIDAGVPVSMVASDGALDDLWEDLEASISSLPQGLHTITVRTKDASGNWSLPMSSSLSVESPISARNTRITIAQFRIDNGTYSSLVVLDGNFDEAFETVIESGIMASSVGLHRLEVRFRGVDGSWSPSFKTVFSTENPLSGRSTNISLAEFQVDSNTPEAMIVLDGNWNEAFEEVLFQNGTVGAAGLHTLRVRMMGVDGQWSSWFSNTISVEQAITARSTSLVEAEFWLDGESPVAMIVFDGNWDEAFEQAQLSSIVGASASLRTLSVRFKGTDGQWSSVFNTILSVEEPILARDLRLSAAEFWIDAESPTAMLVSDGNWDEAFERVFQSGISAPSPGLHTLNVRVQGLDGTWGTVFTTVFSSEEELTARISNLSIAEIYFDGNTSPSFPLLSFDGNLNEAFESAIGQINSAVLVTEGLHSIHCRVRGTDGNWSEDFKTIVYMDPCLSSPVVSTTPAGTLDLCPNDSLLLTASSGLQSYVWYRGAEELSGGSSLWVTEPGYYYVVGYDSNDCPGVSEGVWINAVGTPALTLSASGPTEFCQGAETIFSVSGNFVSFEWNDGSTGNSLAVNSSGEVYVSGLTVQGCTVYSDTVNVQVYDGPPAPSISYTDDLILCQGDSLLLTSSIGTGITWSTGSNAPSIWVSTGGDYNLSFEDGQGCVSISETVSVIQSQVSAQISPSGDSFSLCQGQSVNILAEDGPGFEFEWRESGVPLGVTSSSLEVNTAGAYSVLVSDQLGCSAISDTLQIEVLPLPDATISADGAVAFCEGASVNLSVNDGVSWLWNTGATSSSIEATVAGNYQVLVTAANGCQQLSEFFNVDVTSPLAGLNASPSIVWLPDSEVSFTASTIGNIVSYTWDFGDGNGSNDPGPVHTYSASGIYDISLTVEDDNGCTGSISASQLVEVWEIFENDSLGSGGNTTVTGVAFINTLIGCITLSDGTVLSTTDGGVTWIDVTGSINATSLNDILLTGTSLDNIAIVVGPGGIAAVSNNGGPWITPATGTSENLTNVVEGSPGSGIYYATGDNGTVLCYQNGSWTDISFPGGSGINFGSPYWWNGVLWVIGSNGFLYGWNGSWSSYGGGFGAGGGGGIGGGGLGFGGGGSGIGVFGSGSGAGIWTSSDGGGTWTQTWPGNGYGINSVTVVNENLIICAGDHGMVLVSTDGGQTWQVLSVGNTEDLTDVEDEGCQGYLTGADGGFYVFLIPGYEAIPPGIGFTPSLNACTTEPILMYVTLPRPGNTYTWNTGEVGTQIEITSTGDYFVTMEEFCDTVSTVPYTVTIEIPLSWHPDLDEDGFGDFYTEVLACEQPGPEYVLDNRDCFDDDPNLVLCCPGDFNNDGVINTGDLVVLLTVFGQNCGSPFCGGDINGDGITNTADLTTLLGLYGTTCE